MTWARQTFPFAIYHLHSNISSELIPQDATYSHVWCLVRGSRCKSASSSLQCLLLSAFSLVLLQVITVDGLTVLFRVTFLTSSLHFLVYFWRLQWWRFLGPAS